MRQPYFGERVVLASQDERPVYEGGLDRFVSRDTAQEKQVISVELWKDADEEKSKLFDLVELVQNRLLKAKDGASQKTANLRSCKWDEVMSEVKATSQRWKTAPSRTAKARRCLEKLGQNSETLQAWLRLLPAGDYGASICGAFKLAIGAANQYHRIEDYIFEALSDIPEAMENAGRYVSIYREHPTPFLERKTFDLYLAVLKALNHIMQFFADDSIRKFFSALGKQSSYKEELLKSVQEVKKHTVKIKEEALASSAEEQARTRRKIDQTYIKLDTAEKVLNSIYSLLYDRLGSVKKEQWTALFNANQPLMAIENTIKRESAGHDQYIKAAKRLLKSLRYDSRLLVDDIATCLKLGDILDEDSKARAAAMVQSEKLKTWLIEGATSRMLLVNGHSDLASAEGQSHLSLVDAELVTISERMKSAFVIKYFCGLHTENVGSP